MKRRKRMPLSGKETNDRLCRGKRIGRGPKWERNGDRHE